VVLETPATRATSAIVVRGIHLLSNAVVCLVTGSRNRFQKSVTL
jgi:hypothetical protein